MSDTRIYSGGWSGGQSPDQGPARGDVARFRAAHKLGDVVRGTFLRLEDSHTGWVDLDGEKLLALLPETGPRPAPGEAVFFRIDAFTPEVVLRFVAQGGGWKSGAYLAPSVLAGAYSSARDVFDALLRRSLWEKWEALPPSRRPGAREAYATFLSANEEALATYINVQGYATALAGSFAVGGVREFCYLPWIMPSASSVEAAVVSHGKESRLLAGAVLASGRQVRLNGLILEGAQSECVLFRLGVADSGEKAPLPEASELSRRNWRCIGVDRVQTGSASFIFSLLALAERVMARPGFARKV
jgi:hypothetical protein